MPARKHLRIFAPLIASFGLAAALAVPATSAASLSDALTPDGRVETTSVATTTNHSIFVGCAWDSIKRTFYPSYDPIFQAFFPFGDNDWYALVPQGDFESMPTWSNDGNVTLAPSSDPFAVTGTLGESSLRLQSGGWVRTPLLCVDLLTPHLRFVATATGNGELDVETRLIGCPRTWISRSSTSISPSDHRSWQPSARIDLNTSCLGPGRTGIVDVRFRSEGDWLIDDVMIDPYKRG